MERIFKIKEIEGYDVTFLELGYDDNTPNWICAYVKLKGKILSEYEYPNETFRDNDILGIDTNHLHNQKQCINEKYQDAIIQITELIKYHKTNN